jgi:pyruvate dehydrogenase E2 component (dihydrolipoamide acetyltransferase)
MSDIKAITMPKFGMTMEEGTVDSWVIAEGDSFSAGDPLVTIESSKLSNDLEAPFDGTLRRIVAQAGEELPVGALIGVAADPSVPDSEIDQFVSEHQVAA